MSTILTHDCTLHDVVDGKILPYYSTNYKKNIRKVARYQDTHEINYRPSTAGKVPVHLSKMHCIDKLLVKQELLKLPKTVIVVGLDVLKDVDFEG